MRTRVSHDEPRSLGQNRSVGQGIVVGIDGPALFIDQAGTALRRSL